MKAHELIKALERYPTLEVYVTPVPDDGDYHDPVNAGCVALEYDDDFDVVAVRLPRVKHRDTGAVGTVTALTARLSDVDTMGPWSYVEFDDGLRCWITDESLRETT